MRTLALLSMLLAVGVAAPSVAAQRDAGAVRQVFTELQRNAWYLPTADGAARLYVTEIGEGDPVIFLHGGPGNDFNYIVEALLPHRRRHRFMLFDDRGSLLSPVAPDRQATLTLTTLVADLEQLRIATGQAKLTLFGHSFGSLLALAYFQAHPDRVERLVLTGAFPPAGTLAATVAAMRPRQRALRTRPAVPETLRREGLDGPVEALSPRQRSMRTRIENLAALNVVDLRRWRQVEGGGVYYNQATDGRIGESLPAQFDFGAALLAHPVPVTVIQGDADYLDPAASGWQAFRAVHPDARITIKVIAAATHYAWIDGPAAFATALAAGLDRR